MQLVAELGDLEQLRFEVEEAAKAVPPLQTIFFEFQRYPIPMEFTITAAKELIALMQREMVIEKTCIVALIEDKRYVVTNVDTGRR